MFYQDTKISDLKACSVCLHTFLDPRILPCGDTFCKVCIESLKSTNGNKIVCVQCKEEHAPTENEYPKNKIALELIKVKPNEVIQSRNVCELIKKLNLLNKEIESMQSNLDNRALYIHEYCSKLKRDSQLNTEIQIEQIQKNNEALIEYVNEFEKKCVANYEALYDLDKNGSIGELIKSLNQFYEEKSKYLAEFQVDEDEIEEFLELAEKNLDELRQKSSEFDQILFMGKKIVFKANDVDEYLGSFVVEVV